jgi:hypothetical protein
MQGELYGLHTAETSAQISIRCYAASMAPGSRARRLSKVDLASEFMNEQPEKSGVDVLGKTSLPSSTQQSISFN